MCTSEVEVKLKKAFIYYRMWENFGNQLCYQKQYREEQMDVFLDVVLDQLPGDSVMALGYSALEQLAVLDRLRTRTTEAADTFKEQCKQCSSDWGVDLGYSA